MHQLRHIFCDYRTHSTWYSFVAEVASFGVLCFGAFFSLSANNRTQLCMLQSSLEPGRGRACGEEDGKEKYTKVPSWGELYFENLITLQELISLAMLSAAIVSKNVIPLFAHFTQRHIFRVSVHQSWYLRLCMQLFLSPCSPKMGYHHCESVKSHVHVFYFSSHFSD